MSRARPNVSAVTTPSRRPLFLAAGAIVLTVTLAYGNSFRVPFLFDDQRAILGNTTIRDLWSFDVFAAPLDATGATGRPLVNASLALNYALGGRDVRGYHLFNLLLHLGSALLVFGLVRRTLETVGRDRHGLRSLGEGGNTPPAGGVSRDQVLPPYGQNALPVAALTALLWAVHPLQTESVTCIIQRTELLGGFFLLLTLYCFGRATQAPPAGTGAAGRWWAAGALAACTLGMAAKEFMVVAPVLALLYDRTFAAGSFRSAWTQRRRLYLGLAASWLILAALLIQNPQRNQNVGFGLGISSWEYLLTQCRAIVLYLKLTVWPHPLVLDYGTPVVHRLAEVWWQAGLLVTLAAGTLWALWRRPAFGFLGAWFFVILAPSSSVVPLVSQTIAEHRMYLPLLPVLLLGVLAVRRFSPRFAPVVCVLAGVCAVLTWQRNAVYATRLSIWSDTAAHAPDNHRAHYNLGNALAAAGRPGEAVVCYATALSLKPGDATISYNLASALMPLGRSAEAIGHFESVLRQGPDAADLRVNLAVALAQSGRLPEAILHFQRATELEPRADDIRINLARALLLQGRVPEAVREFRIALEINPASAAARAGLREALQSRP